MKWYLQCFKKYATFEGRARRKEYWMFFLFNTIIALIAATLDNILGITFKNEIFGIIYLVYSIALFMPSWSVGVRRLHDVGKSGWNLLWGIIPLIGTIYLLILTVRDSEFGDNKYGPNPKGKGPTTDYTQM